MEPYLRINFRAGRVAGSADIVAAVKAAAEQSGRGPVCRLPPVRVLAHQLGISKNTVHAAYDELMAQGVVESKKRQGVYLSASASRASVPHADLAPPNVQTRAARLTERTVVDNSTIALCNVFIDPDLLPREKITECFRSVLKNPGIHAFFDVQGYGPLRETIAHRLQKRGIPAAAKEVVVTTGSQQALDVVCRGLTIKKIATENPAYVVGKRLFELNNVAITPLPFDPFRGVDLSLWQKILHEKTPALMYLTSNFQNPTGYSYSTEEHLAILAMAKATGCGILEDDWGSDMLSFSEYRPPLRSLGGAHVLYMNSYTKKLLPSLRLGYLLANEQTLPGLLEARRVATLGGPTIVEAALHEFLDRGYYDTHLTKLHKALDERYQAALTLLRDAMPEEVRWTSPGGGPLIWLEVPEHVDIPDLRDTLGEKNVHIGLTDDGFFGAPHLHGIRLGYAYPKPQALEKGITLLAEAIKDQLCR